MDYFIHPEGICESEKVGRGTRVWAFAHVLPGATIGQDCNLCDGVFLVCLSGSVDCLLDDGQTRRVVRLDNPAKGLHMPPMTWGAQYNYSEDAILGVFASLPYDSADYIREYEDFPKLKATQER